MTQKKKTGMKLSQEIFNKKGNGWILSLITVLLAFLSVICIFREMTGIPSGASLGIMLLTGICLCIAGTYAGKAGKTSLFYPFILILLFIFVLFFRQQILAGGCLAWNSMGDIILSNTGFIMPAWEISAVTKTGFEEWMFSILAGALSALLSCFMNTACSVGLTVLLPALLFAGSILLNREMSVITCLVVLGTSLFILIRHGGKEKRESGAVLSGWLHVCILLGILLPVSLLPGVKKKTEEVADSLHDRIHEYRYETADTFLPEGDLSKEPVSAGMDRTALIVTAEVPETMYLRGFTGAVLKDDVWASLDKNILVENKDLLYWINLNEFQSDSQFEKAAEAVELKTQAVTIQNVSACSQYLYVPFQVCRNTSLKPENLNQEGVPSDGDRTYRMETVIGGAGQIQEVLKQLRESDSAGTDEYRKAESAYREFIYEHYLAVPQETAALMEEVWKEVASSYGNIDQLTSQQAQECVLTVLKRCFPEDGKTDIENLPVSKAAGTSYQYATTAVMTLRYFGIPARYAEGFVISEEMTAKAEAGESIEVNGSCGMAWPEVYQDGIGWIPMALTPGMEEEEQQNQDKNAEGVETVIKEGEEMEEEPDDMPDEPEAEGGSMVTVTRQVTGGLLKAALAIIFLFLIVVLRRMMLLKKKKKRFADENCKEAIGWIFADISVLLQKMGFDRKNGSMETLCRPAGEVLGVEFEESLHRMISLNACALFSSKALTEEQRKEMLQFRESTIEQLKAQSKWSKRIWMQWIQCLY